MTKTARLSDGRQIRALGGICNQVQMFALHKSGLYDPVYEVIMTVKDHDDSLQSGAYRAINVVPWWRTSEYCFYPRGFEKKTIPIGDKLIYVEKGVSYAFDIPGVPVNVNGETISLRKTVGIGIIPIEKLELRQVDETHFTVSVTTDFDPATDVRVVDIMRPRGWALTDEHGYPLRSKPSHIRIPKARYPFILHADNFDVDSTGYHGSLSCVADGDGRSIVPGADWSPNSGVSVIDHPAAVPRIGMSHKTLVTGDNGTLRVRLTKVSRGSLHLTDDFEGAITHPSW